MELGGGFEPAMLGPIDAGGDQCDGARIHHVNDAPETMRQTFTSASSAKAGRKGLEVLEHRPEQPFGQRRVAVFIGVGKVVAAGRPCPAQSRKRPTVQPQGITDIIEADGVGQLRKEHADHVTPRTEGSRPGIHPGLARQFRHQMRGNQIAKLSENRELRGGWFGVSFFHLCRVAELKSQANLFLPSNSSDCGMAVNSLSFANSELTFANNLRLNNSPEIPASLSRRFKRLAPSMRVIARRESSRVFPMAVGNSGASGSSLSLDLPRYSSSISS